MFLQFFSEKSIFANFHVYIQHIQICEGALTLWRHSDIIWSSKVLILVSMDKRDPYLYTGSKNKKEYQAFRIENPGKRLQQLPSKDVLQKYLRRNEGLSLFEKLAC